MSLFWALCKRCKNNLLKVYFTEDAMGARCGHCGNRVFEVQSPTLKDIKLVKEKNMLEDKVLPLRQEKSKNRSIN